MPLRHVFWMLWSLVSLSRAFLQLPYIVHFGADLSNFSGTNAKLWHLWVVRSSQILKSQFEKSFRPSMTQLLSEDGIRFLWCVCSFISAWIVSILIEKYTTLSLGSWIHCFQKNARNKAKSTLCFWCWQWRQPLCYSHNYVNGKANMPPEMNPAWSHHILISYDRSCRTWWNGRPRQIHRTSLPYRISVTYKNETRSQKFCLKAGTFTRNITRIVVVSAWWYSQRPPA